MSTKTEDWKSPVGDALEGVPFRGNAGVRETVARPAGGRDTSAPWALRGSGAQPSQARCHPPLAS